MANRCGSRRSLFGEEELRHEIMHVPDEGMHIFTIDNGASEHALTEGQAHQLKTVISAGSQAGLVYTAARRTMVPTQGEKAVSFRATAWHSCMQPLTSVSRLCGLQHRAVLDSQTWYIQHGRRTLCDHLP